MASKGKLLLAGVAVVVVAAAAVVFGPGLLGGAKKSDGIAATAGGPTVLRRLTQAQYQHVIADVFGNDIKIGGRFEPDMRESGLIEVGAGKVSVPASGLEQYGKMARSVAAQVFDKVHRDTMVDCKPASVATPDDACAARFLSQVGRLLYRRPLTDEEQKALVQGANDAAKGVGNFYAGLEITLASMLQAPQFLFAWENARDGELDGYSKAARLSFFLWDTAPDDELLTAAAKGELDNEKGLAKQVDRLLSSPRVEAGVRAYFADMFGFDGFDNLSKDPAIYPKYSFGLATDAQEQTLRTITNLLLTHDGDYRDVFTTRDTFMSRSLGAVYGIPVPKDAPGASADGWQPYSFPPDDPRSGILMQVSYLSLHSHPGRTSPTLRGKALRETVLCQKVPDPPGNVNFNVVQDTKNPLYKTVRQRLEAHRTQPTCTGCHKMMDPIGLSLENFDSIGTYRAGENGTAIDASGEMDGVKFANAQGLGKAIHDHPATTACLVNRIYAYAVGRTPTKSESEWLRSDVMKDFSAAGYRLRPLLREIATSGVFFRVAGPANDAQPVRQASAQGVGQ
ncbi:MAG TPA: DUF1592 domain-containing protein [Alphaproteobacteria bacterium]|nr:DUF1592 domain-containing protein [Alphaproteobacteria bacterium]